MGTKKTDFIAECILVMHFNRELFMIDKELIEKIKQLKRDRRLTLHELSKKIDVSISTLERWLKTGRINRIYAGMVKERLNIN